MQCDNCNNICTLIYIYIYILFYNGLIIISIFYLIPPCVRSFPHTCVGARLDINSAVTINLFLTSYYNQSNIITIYIIIQIIMFIRVVLLININTN